MYSSPKFSHPIQAYLVPFGRPKTLVEAGFIHSGESHTVETKLQRLTEVWSVDCATGVFNGHNPSSGGSGRLHVARGG